MAVGDEEPSGSAEQALTAISGVPLQDLVVATFTDPDNFGSFSDFTAEIDWADGTVSSNNGVDVSVIPTDTAGRYAVVGSHTYDTTADDLPIGVTVISDGGARLELQGELDVEPLAEVEESELDGERFRTLRINGTSGDDTINVRFDGTELTFDVGSRSVTRNVAGDDNVFGTSDDLQAVVIVAGDGNDTVDLTSGNANNPVTYPMRIIAGGGDDTVTGGLGADTVEGGAGNDEIFSGGGNDVVDAGAGDDYVFAGADLATYDQPTLDAGFFDRDTIVGGEGDDTLSGGLDENVIEGGPGNDLLNGSGSRDTLRGGEGDDLLRGFGNRDLLVGGEGNDTLEGDAASGPRAGGGPNGGLDTLEGGAGIDRLFGRDGNDLFRGGTGDDFLFGGDGDDTDEDREAGDTVDSIENTIS